MVNLNELESEERDIESFKRFNYYFDPPKNKPKINLNVKDIMANNSNSSSSGGAACMKPPGNSNHVVRGGSSGTDSTGSSSSSSVSNDNNPGGISIGEDIQPIRPQAPIGTPSLKGLPSAPCSAPLYPATSDSPASSASIFDGISSSLSSHAHSCDDLFNDLLSSAASPGNLSLNLNLAHLQQSNSDPVVYDNMVYAGRAPSVAGSSSVGAARSSPAKPTADLSQSIISN